MEFGKAYIENIEFPPQECSKRHFRYSQGCYTPYFVYGYEYLSRFQRWARSIANQHCGQAVGGLQLEHMPALQRRWAEGGGYFVYLAQGVIFMAGFHVDDVQSHRVLQQVQPPRQ